MKETDLFLKHYDMVVEPKITRSLVANSQHMMSAQPNVVIGGLNGYCPFNVTELIRMLHTDNYLYVKDPETLMCYILIKLYKQSHILLACPTGTPIKAADLLQSAITFSGDQLVIQQVQQNTDVTLDPGKSASFLEYYSVFLTASHTLLSKYVLNVCEIAKYDTTDQEGYPDLTMADTSAIVLLENALFTNAYDNPAYAAYVLWRLYNDHNVLLPNMGKVAPQLAINATVESIVGDTILFRNSTSATLLRDDFMNPPQCNRVCLEESQELCKIVEFCSDNDLPVLSTLVNIVKECPAQPALGVAASVYEAFEFYKTQNGYA